VTPLEIYRDDGPLAARVLGRAGLVEGRLAWMVPPSLRALEYGLLIALAALAEPDALPACFAFVAVLAMHHYDVVYRLRHQRVAPPRWVWAVGGGWETRLALAGVLTLAGVLEWGLVVAAVVLGVVYVAESTASWIRFGRARGGVAYEDADDDEDGD
jgi:hypothetical protein